MKTKLSTTAFAICAMTLSSHAATTFLGGNLDTAGSWDNGLPDAADDGIVAVSGTLDGNQNFGGPHVTNQTAGTLTGGNNGFNFINGTYNLQGGTISARFILANNSTINLLGGNALTGSGTAGTQFKSANGGTLNVGGSVVITASREISEASMSNSVANGTTNYANDWTGSFTMAGYDATKWEAALVDSNTFFNGTEITSSVFTDNFQVSIDGETVSLIAPVPEPSSSALLGLGGLALILRRRK